MKSILIGLVVLIGTFVSSSEAATFAGVSTWTGGFRLGGTLPRTAADTDATGFGGVTDIVATVENGTIRFDTLELRSGVGSNISATSSGDFINPITFQQTTISAEVTIDAFSYSLNLPTQSLVSNGGQLQFSNQDQGNLTVSGTYAIVGGTGSATGTFTNSFQILGTDPDDSILDVSDFPNSVSFENWGYLVLGGTRFTAPIVNEIVDGVSIDLEFSFNRNYLSPFGTGSTFTTLVAVPEPSAAGLLLLAGCGALMRRRKPGS